MNALATLRTKMARAIVLLLWVNLPVAVLFGFAFDLANVWTAASAIAAFAAVATFVVVRDPVAPATRYVVAAAFALVVSTIVFLFQSHPWQIDWHMYYFAALAVLASFCCAPTIIVAAGLVAVHHLLLNFILPAAVFPEGASVVRVLLHAGIVLIETGVLVWLTRHLADALLASERALEEAHASQAEVDKVARQRLLDAADAESKRRADLLKVAAQFEQSLGRVVKNLNAVVEAAETEANALNRSAGQSRLTASSAAATAGSVTSGVQTVAAAAEELTASIAAITQQVSAAAEKTESASRRAQTVTQAVEQLSDSAQQIGSVVQLINEIASQTNLLALNATIEAARAGEMGKGFAVVAGEVKGLASQTARATEEIGQRILEIQTKTQDAVRAISEIASSIASIDGVTSSLADAVEQQGAATRAIASTAQAVAASVTETARSVDELSNATEETGCAAARVTTLSGDLKRALGDLEDGSRAFLNSLRVA
jgi:methyl-accepting chemotaxis protein